MKIIIFVKIHPPRGPTKKIRELYESGGDSRLQEPKVPAWKQATTQELWASWLF
jgi:hypothetical protein